ncbi:hypothetical protein HPP92_006313 [Vanilla planifolia]|uniref:DUF7910 domain-containing protein n=1 Tax=Vanilla planifolia TaxID=51239 RepID=A0A835RR85_VANPL|nr:hypothetical protein HPP92_006313 [Vanilla planifolia]
MFKTHAHQSFPRALSRLSTSVVGWSQKDLFQDGTQIRLKSVAHNKYLSSEKGGGSTVDANRQVASGWETFKCLFVDLLRPTQMAVTANHPEDTNWGDNDPSIFLLSVVGQLQGEFQVTNGYGRDKASSVMMEIQPKDYHRPPRSTGLAEWLGA